MPMGIPAPNLDNWRGYAEDYVECYKLLISAMNEPWDEELEKRVRFGCSCGHCLEGVMSPRVKFYILAYIYESARIIKTRWGAETNENIAKVVSGIFTHLPPTLSDISSKEPFQRGFATLLEYIGICLEENEIPTADKVGKKLDWYRDMGEGEDTQRYLNLGGTINDALSYLFAGCCYKTWSAVFKELDEAKEIPHCDNDDLITPVRLFACGTMETERPKSTLESIPLDAVLGQMVDMLTGYHF